MSSTVFYADTRTRSHSDSKIAKIARLCNALGLKKIIKKNEPTAVKLHFGEYGNDTHINPAFVAQVVDKIVDSGGKPFLTDTTTLYSGSRKNAVDHLQTAYAHGFAPSVVHAPVIIADGIYGENDMPVRVNAKHFKEVFIATEIRRAPALVVLSHFKGHEMAGFGGAIKNLAMGGAAVRGKRAQHATKVLFTEKNCTGCGRCVSVCPQKALRSAEGKTHFDAARCIGCFECITVCPVKAVDTDWNTEMRPFIERMTEYALGVVKGRTKRVCFINFALSVTPDCDCAGWSDALLVPDIGILASRDPVALDQACFDLVHKAPSLEPSLAGKTDFDKFKARWPKTFGPVQLSYGEEIGLGSRAYTLQKI
ncbi:MAG: 4Fe-4S ferredoxin [Candidatus Desulfovibrio kirbyi]|uniref:4Fe-4S ferredoxin n=1 Tax=Candidatus Desulfovibrio kirbyi TaxID=2696086 RepID=A0A6L2R5N7_9BACT|nr:MAG: 4Fe-4S ferredoxin [Candidatus Desulfovibrio kirbyi]